MVTNHNPYIVIDLVSFEKMMEYLRIGKQMAEKSYLHLTEDYDRVISNAKNVPNHLQAHRTNPKPIKHIRHGADYKKGLSRGIEETGLRG